MTPEQIAKSGTEHAQQAALICWANQIGMIEYPCLKWLYANANGGLRDCITAGKMKAEGVKAGVADLLLPVRIANYSGLYIEMKVGKNKPTSEQVEFGKFVIDQGFMWVCCYSWIEAKVKICDYLELDNKKVYIHLNNGKMNARQTKKLFQ